MTPDEIKAELPEYAVLVDTWFGSFKGLFPSERLMATDLAKARKKNRIAEEMINWYLETDPIYANSFTEELLENSNDSKGYQPAYTRMRQALKQMQEVDG